MRIPFVYIAMPCVARLEARGNSAVVTGSSERSKCLLMRRLRCSPIEGKFRRTVCPEVRQVRQGKMKSVPVKAAGVCPQTAALTHLREHSSASKRPAEAAGALRESDYDEAKKEKASKR